VSTNLSPQPPPRSGEGEFGGLPTDQGEFPRGTDADPSPPEGGIRVSVLVPAYNEAARIGATVRAARAALGESLPAGAFELIVADDGSRDETAALAEAAGAGCVLRGPHAGKGAALRRAAAAARGDLFLLLDADLGETAAELVHLLRPVLAGEADMTIAIFAAAGGTPRAGFGWVIGLARWGVRRLTGRTLAAPLSGQRAMRREVWERVGGPEGGFGAEVGFDVDALRAGFRVLEVPTAMAHAATGRDVRGFLHRGRQFVAVARVLGKRALHPSSPAAHDRRLAGTRRR
jgi:glycosyltransferase involved in cell wall biosynthesis